MSIDATSTDKDQLDRLTTSFFSVFTSKENMVPDLNGLYALCIPATLIIQLKASGRTIYTLDSFIEPREKLFSTGTLSNFEETEMEEQTQIAGQIAQRQSRYHKTGYMNGVYFTQNGNKFFQFIKTENGWRICTVVWEDD